MIFGAKKVSTRKYRNEQNCHKMLPKICTSPHAPQVSQCYTCIVDIAFKFVQLGDDRAHVKMF